jgi:hypothetical protein
MNLKSLAACATALAVLAASPAAFAQHPGAAPQAGKEAEAPKGTTVTLQGGAAEWIKDPHWHSYYDMTKQAFAQGPTKVDVDGFEQKSFVLFRDFGKSMGVPPEHMQDHLKLIPRQIVQIVREDPHVLDSYQNFVDAAFGPQ